VPHDAIRPRGCRAADRAGQARWLFRTLHAAELAGLDPAIVIRTAVTARNLAGIAALMDDRTRRLGQHTAQTAPARAIAALGPVPDGAASRQDWERKASSIAAYRETYGYGHPGDPIGPEPTHDAPDQRAAWHQVLTALTPASGPGVRAMPDGRLWLLRDTYAAATACAPLNLLPQPASSASICIQPQTESPPRRQRGSTT
jgi:hypothetical protein